MGVKGTITPPEWKKRQTLRRAARQGMPLSGDDVQALEAALRSAEMRADTLAHRLAEAEEEIAHLREERDTWMCYAMGEGATTTEEP